MAITHPTAVRNAAADAVVDRVDAGAAAGYMEIRTSGDAVLATITLDDPGFGNAGASVAGRADAAGMPNSAVATGTGTAAKFVIFDSDATEVFRGSVTASGGGGDAIIDNVSIASGQTVNLTALTYMALSA